MRNSPRASLLISRSNENPAARTETFAEGTRPPLASWMTPRRAPRGFCAANSNGRRVNRTNKERPVLRQTSCFGREWSLIARARLRKCSGLLPQVVGISSEQAGPKGRCNPSKCTCLKVSGGKLPGDDARKRELRAKSERGRCKQPSRGPSRWRESAPATGFLAEAAEKRASAQRARKDRDHRPRETYREMTGAEACPSFAPLAGAPRQAIAPAGNRRARLHRRPPTPKALSISARAKKERGQTEWESASGEAQGV